jgi:hypothetical protein
MSVGEILDKYSILHIKSTKINDQNKLLYILKELEIIKKIIQDNLIDLHHQLIQELIQLNTAMWLCNDERKEKINANIFDDEYLQLTIQESKLNDQRFAIKQQIDSTFNSDLREQKNYLWL